ncbi:type II toxin-antitoxin system HigB family toxin [Deinococcus sp.]|uniref:type II toxin-antitoxin system HigB family toxin n=1 Tax=Deinococcus sp. TaxID=47478 RepID=UPI003B5B61D1
MATRVIALGTLRAFQTQYPDAADALQAWHTTIKAAELRTFADVQNVFPKVSWVAPDYLIFNICGGAYRLIVTINFPAEIVYIKSFLPHKLYDAWLPDSQRLKTIKLEQAQSKRTRRTPPQGTDNDQ